MGLRQHRGRRAGRVVQAGRPVLRPLGNGTCIVSGYRPPMCHRHVYGSERLRLVLVSVHHLPNRSAEL